MRRREPARPGLLSGWSLAGLTSAACALALGCGSGGAETEPRPSDAVTQGAGGGGGLGEGGAGGDAGPYDGPPIPWAYEPFPEVPTPPSGPDTDAQKALGRWLLYDPILSGDLATACITCHSEQWGLGDGLPTSIGIRGEGPVGPGRSGPTSTSRNAPSLWNVGHRRSLFWDGRSASLEVQALEPMRNAIELGKDPAQVVTDLAAIPAYVTLFEEAFPDESEPLTPDTLARALAAVQRTFVSRRAPYDQYVGGDAGAIDDEALRGMELFAEAGCHGCHVPPLFASDTFADRGVGADDVGREAVSGQAADRGAFRVPSLRNARDTEPYFHDGSVATLEEAVAIEARRQVEEGASRALDAAELAAVVRFLEKSLQDTSESPERPDAVPSGLPIPEDGFRIPR